MSRWQKTLLVAGLALVGTVGSVIGLTTQSVSAGVDNFYFDKMEVDYYLSKNAEGRSQLRVKEVFYPVFPEYNQNRGIIRSIPLTYQNHTVDLKMGEMLRDDRPAPVYKNETKSGFRVLTIRDRSDVAYLHGQHKFEFNYTMSDVTMKPKNSPRQEFYWDTNGTGWRQRFNQIVARVHLDESVRADFNPNQIACYSGLLRSTSQDCFYQVSAGGDVVTFTTNKPLGAGGNMTLALQFGEATFASYKISGTHRLLAALVAILGTTGVVLTVIALIHRQILASFNKPATIVTEYLPPADIDAFQATVVDNGLANYSNKIMPAGLVDLAIARKIQIIEKDSKSIFSKNKDYVIKVLPGKTWTEREEAFFFAVFKFKPVADREFKLDRHDYGMGSRIGLFTERTVKSLDGIVYDKQASKQAIRPVLIMIVVAMMAATGSFVILISSLQSVSHHNMERHLARMFVFFEVPVLQIVTIVVGVFGLILALNFKQLTPIGLSIKAHLKGLRRYIKMAEADRLAFNQSVGGAMRDAKDRVVLYERLLPYAVIFGLEKSWGKVLNAVYQEADYVPAWYFGTQAFNAASFANTISSFSSVASSASSSGSSGSGGGGFSGGGGGGGGGGGC